MARRKAVKLWKPIVTSGGRVGAYIRSPPDPSVDPQGLSRPLWYVVMSAVSARVGKHLCVCCAVASPRAWRWLLECCGAEHAGWQAPWRTASTLRTGNVVAQCIRVQCIRQTTAAASAAGSSTCQHGGNRSSPMGSMSCRAATEHVWVVLNQDCVKIARCG